MRHKWQHKWRKLEIRHWKIAPEHNEENFHGSHSLQFLPQDVLCGTSFTRGLGPKNPQHYHLSIGEIRQSQATHLTHLFFILMQSGRSSWWWHGVDYAVPTVTYSKAAWGRQHCCLWSADDRPACCTSSTLADSWCEGSRACTHWLGFHPYAFVPSISTPKIN